MIDTPSALPSEHFVIGGEVFYGAASCGTLTKVVIDPLDHVLTHIVVEPKHRKGLGRLVPVSLSKVHNGEIELMCSEAQFEELPHAEEIRFFPGTSGALGYGAGEAMYWPYFGVGNGAGGLSGMGMTASGFSPVVHDLVPNGEIEVQRGDHVHASDGDIGHIEGFIIDRANHQVTHLVLHEGHIFGAKDVSIPIEAVSRVDGCVELRLTKREIRALPPVPLR